MHDNNLIKRIFPLRLHGTANRNVFVDTYTGQFIASAIYTRARNSERSTLGN